MNLPQMKKPLFKQLKLRVIQWIFNRYYQNFLYPFTIADGVWYNKSENQRWIMYEEVTNWVESEAYKIEHENIIQAFYKDLAEASKTEEQIAGYRLALLVEKSRDIRLKTLAARFKEIKILEQRGKSLSK